MEKTAKTIPFFEKTSFLIGVTLFGGYVNTYNFVARGGNMISFHTGNQIRCGMSLAYQNWNDFFFYLMPVLMCFAGVCLSEILKAAFRKSDWRRYTLFAEAVILFAVGFVPNSLDTLTTYVLCVLAGTHFCIFRSWEGQPHNTTIATGNLRSLAQLFCKAVTDGSAAGMKFLRYFCLFLSFPFGAFLGTWVTLRLGNYGICPLGIFMFFWAVIYCMQTKQAAQAKAA